MKHSNRILFLLLLLNTSQVNAMGLFDFFTIHVFSPVTGVVTLNGEPVEGAEIVRTADHEEDKIYTDSVKSDIEGKFSFNDISTFSLRPIMLGTIIRQKIIIKHNGYEYLAWRTVKHSNHKYGELNDKDNPEPIKLNLRCELTDDQSKKRIVNLKYLNGIVVGLCEW